MSRPKLINTRYMTASGSRVPISVFPQKPQRQTVQCRWCWFTDIAEFLTVVGCVEWASDAIQKLHCVTRAYRGRLCRLCVISSIMQKVLRAASYSTVSYSAWSEACDPCMFPPEKISPDSLLEGEYMLDGMFVFFICSVSLHSPFLHPFPSLLAAFYDDSLFSSRFNVWSPSPIYICFFSFLNFSLCSSFLSLSVCHCVSALCPVAEESRLGPSSVYGKVALQLAACPTRGLSLPGLATHTSALMLPWLRCNGPAGSRLLARHWKVNSCERRRQVHPVPLAYTFEFSVLCGVGIRWFWVGFLLFLMVPIHIPMTWNSSEFSSKLSMECVFAYIFANLLTANNSLLICSPDRGMASGMAVSVSFVKSWFPEN